MHTDRPSGGLNFHRASRCVESSHLAFIACAAVAWFLMLGLPSFGAASGQTIAKPGTTNAILRGTLGVVAEKGPSLQTSQKNYILQGQSAYLLHVLEDKRLLNQELQVEGTAGAGGTFIVDRIYAVRNGKLYKIQYYCDVCNITYVQPGHCYCCGRETKLQEVPVTSANP